MISAEQGSASLDLMVIAEAPVPAGLDQDALRPLVAHVLKAEMAIGDWTVCIVFTSDEALQRLHAQFMGLDSPTDIMTFPYAEEDAGQAQEQGGDIVISVDRAGEQAADDAWDLASELRFLVAHGLLHLLGWDDATPAQRQAMLDRQRALISGDSA